MVGEFGLEWSVVGCVGGGIDGLKVGEGVHLDLDEHVCSGFSSQKVLQNAE